MRSKLLYPLLFAIMLFYVCTSICCAENVDSIFARVPTEVFSLLDRTAKLDMLDLYNNKLKAAAENVYGGQSEMVRKSKTEIFLRTSDVSTWNMIVLPAENDTVILCLQSVRANGIGTTAVFYDLHWNRVEKVLDHPSTHDYWNTARGLSPNLRAVYERTFSSAPTEITWCDSARMLRFSVSAEGLSREEKKLSEEYLHPIVYRWSEKGKGCFIKQECAAAESIAERK